MSKIVWCAFCQDCPASETLLLVWDDNNEIVDDPILVKFLKSAEVCRNCAQVYHGVSIAEDEEGRIIRTNWDGKPY